MVAMGVGDEDVCHRFVAHGIEQRADMGFIVRAWIDDCHLAVADDVADGPFKGEWARIIGHNSPHAGHRLVHHIGHEIKIFVEGNVVAHALTSDWRIPAYHYFGHTCTPGN